VEVSGLATTSVLDQTSSGSTDPSGTAHAVSPNPTTTVANEILVVQACANATGTYTGGAGYTLIAGGAGGVECATEYRIVASTGTYAGDTSTSANRFVTSVMGTYKILPVSDGVKKLMTLGVGEPN
jgi:hypothetical protein